MSSPLDKSASFELWKCGLSSTSENAEGRGEAVAGGTKPSTQGEPLNEEDIGVKLTDEQLRQIAPFLNRNLNVIAEIRLGSLAGAPSAAFLLVKTIDKRTAEKIRKILN